MADVARTVLLTEEQDEFVTGWMQQHGLSRSQIVRFALDVFRANPILFFGQTSRQTANLKQHDSDAEQVPA